MAKTKKNITKNADSIKKRAFFVVSRAKDKVKTISKRKMLGKYLLLSTAGVLLLCILSFATYSISFHNKNYLHQYVGSTNYGGKTKEETSKLLADKSDQFLKKPLVLSFVSEGKTKEYPLSLVETGLKFDANETANQIWRNGRDENFFQSFFHQLKSLFQSKDYAFSFDLNQDILNGKIADIAKETDAPERDYSISYSKEKNAFVLDENIKNGSRIDQADIISKIKGQVGSADISQISFSTKDYQPQVSKESAQKCLSEANKIIAGGNLILSYQSIQQALDQDTIGTFLQSQVDGHDLKLTFDNNALGALSDGLSKSIDTPAKNAVLGVTNGAVAVTAPEVLGLTLDKDQAKADIESALFSRISGQNTNSTITLKIATQAPQVTQNSFSSLGLSSIIGTGTTNFSGSSANRMINIKTGVNAINGQLVQPGAEFSTITTVSPIDQAHGYVPGLVIVNNQTFPADGGGLCQVSTTLFRAVLNAGLPITARSAHSYEVSYYQRGIGPGLDATIYDPKPDFKWTNDTGHLVYLQGIVNGTTLTFNIFGTSDARVATIDGPTVLSTTEPGTTPIYVNTNTLPVGTTQLIDPPVPGAKTTVNYTVTRNGQTINKQVFNSTYQAMPAQYLVGTAPAPASTPTPEPSPTPTPAAITPTPTG